MAKAAKSYWGGVCCSTERDKDAIKSWFAPLCDDMEPIKCDTLADIETDRTKKVRAIMAKADGKRVVVTRTFGAKSHSIHIKPVRI